jgi:hypothetical protein
MRCGAGICSAANVGGSGGAGGGTGGSGGGAGGAGGGTGGSSGGAGGGVASHDQELVSGTRLRAIFYVGADGSRAPFYFPFYDNQLQTYCNPAPYAVVGSTLGALSTPVCVPTPLPGFTRWDATCTTEIAEDTTASLYSTYFTPALGSLPPLSVKYGFAITDGGLLLRPVTRYQGALGSKLADGGCTASQSSFPVYAPSGGPLPLSTFVSMPAVME